MEARSMAPLGSAARDHPIAQILQDGQLPNLGFHATNNLHTCTKGIVNRAQEPLVAQEAVIHAQTTGHHGPLVFNLAQKVGERVVDHGRFFLLLESHQHPAANVGQIGHAQPTATKTGSPTSQRLAHGSLFSSRSSVMSHNIHRTVL